MNKRDNMLLLFVVLSFMCSPAYASGVTCGPHSVLAPGEYCSFATFVKAGNNDAIIVLSWSALGPGMSGLPTPSMVGDYYFYFKNGKLYYLGNTTGAYELFYELYKGVWYLSDGRAISPENLCMAENITIPKEIRPKLCSCDNVSIQSKFYPAVLNGSTLQILGVESPDLIEFPPSKNSTYSIQLPKNLSLSVPPNVTLRAVFLGKGVLVYTYPERFDSPLSWNELSILYYNGKTLEVLNLSEGLRERLPLCREAPSNSRDSLEYYWIALGGVLVGLGLWKLRKAKEN
ncbi:hypothetical protein [Thermococcus nautili]|uniref:Uncharacterized protein n=1 Tax=Thermococcus nautili TaxID=195522 RepID=W8NSU6_9EURY|nr:hypothetical protein [Thermococcus nautili]AHL22298.1 hypothetical protein BD01_0675 [Thermococcus nautili]